MAAKLIATALLCMLFVQTAGLHMHSHELSGSLNLLEVHVEGNHLTTHDHNSEIELTFDGLLLKLLSISFIAPLAVFAFLFSQSNSKLKFYSYRCTNKLPLVIFGLRPPAHAPPL